MPKLTLGKGTRGPGTLEPGRRALKDGNTGHGSWRKKGSGGGVVSVSSPAWVCQDRFGRVSEVETLLPS